MSWINEAASPAKQHGSLLPKCVSARTYGYLEIGPQHKSIYVMMISTSYVVLKGRLSAGRLSFSPEITLSCTHCRREFQHRGN
jgi:hypothetical protein